MEDDEEGGCEFVGLQKFHECVKRGLSFLFNFSFFPKSELFAPLEL